MHQRHHRANTKLPLETEPDVNHDCQQRQAHGPGPGLDQFRAHLGANELRAPIVWPLSQGFLDGGNRRQLRLFVTFLALDTDKDVFGFAKFLDFHLAKIQPVKLRAQGRNIGGLFELHVDHDAALEIDSEIKAAYGEKEKGQKNHRQRQGKSGDTLSGEVEIGVRRDEFDESHCASTLDWQLFWTAAAKPRHHHKPCDHNSGEHGGDDADGQRNGKTLDGARAELEQEQRRD